MNNYKHETVNHSENFVDPITKAHTNKVERLWLELKMDGKKERGIRTDKLPIRMCEFVWRRNYLKDQESWFNDALKMLSSAHFY